MALPSALTDTALPLSIQHLVLYQKRIQGSLSQRCDLDSINEGYADVRSGRNIRGIITFDA